MPGSWRLRLATPPGARRRLERRLVWVMGSPRSGSTWLLNLLRHGRGVIGIDELAIGVHLGVLMPGFLGLRPHRVEPGRLRLNDVRRGQDDYFFSAAFEPAWLPGVRRMVLDRVGAQVRAAAGRHRLVVIKEPHGSQAADLLTRALPDSRLLFLLRDGRDVVESALDAASAGSWGAEELRGYATADRYRLEFLEDRAHAWLCRTEATQRAYEAHDPARRMRVRYEDLLANPERHLAQVAAWLGLGLDGSEVERAVARLAFERLPESERGPGRFARSATPGIWRQGLDDAEQEAVEQIIGPKLRELGYER